MNRDEIINFVRLQIAEESEAFYLDTDIDTYIKIAISRFANKTKSAIHQQTILLNQHIPADDESAEVLPAYKLDYKIMRLFGSTYIPSDTEPIIITPISPEDWSLNTDDNKNQAGVFKIETNKIDLTFLLGWEGGMVLFEYAVLPTVDQIAEDQTAEIDKIIALIPEEYHITIANYVLSLAYKRDRDHVQSQYYLGEYLREEKDAKKEADQKRISNLNDVFSLDILNPHRNEQLIQDLY